jgi:FAD:protein FMN transferase
MNNPKPNKKILKFFAPLFLLLLLFAVLSASRSRRIEVRKSFKLLGTVVDVQVICKNSSRKKAEAVIDKVHGEIERLENLMSPYREGSDIFRVNMDAASSPVKISEETFRVIKKSIEISNMTDGAFDISFSPAAKIWKLKGENPEIPGEELIREKLALVDYRKIILDDKKKTIFFSKKAMEIGLGGIAKGTAINLAIDVLRKEGFEDALVNAGGDIYASGLNKKNKAWKIGIKNPRNKSEFLAKVDISNRAIVSSGDYERMIMINGKRYHHILDTKTGRPSEKCISVTVVGEDAETADAIATALFVLGPEKGIKLIESIPGMEALIVTPDEKIHTTEGFDIEMVNSTD